MLTYFGDARIVGELGHDGHLELTTVETPDWDLVTGTFTLLPSGALLAFYRTGGVLTLRIGDDVHPLAAVDVTHHSDDAASYLTVRRDDQVRVVAYPAGPWHRSVDIEQPFASEEDWDVGLFIANVARDAHRATRIFRPHPRA